MRPYDYKSLTPLKSGQIRLLKLHPGESSSELRGQLIVHAIRPGVEKTTTTNVTATKGAGEGKTKEVTSRNPQADQDGLPSQSYRALSYTWGSEPPSGMITIIHNNEPYTISIKPNLESALIQLRSDEVALFFWIDALCMDQKDNEEKSAQIPMMSEIYNKAERVCIWLGPRQGKSDLAIDFIKRCVNLDDIDQLCMDPKHSEEWDALLTLMRRPWFNRRWIVQELARARKAIIHCGNKSQSWQEFADAVSLFSFKQDDIRKLFKQSDQYHHHPDYIGDLDELGAVRLVYAWDNLFRKSEDGRIHENMLSLEALMSFLTVFEASDPRDTLYAILWLAKDAKPVDKHPRDWEQHLERMFQDKPASLELQFNSHIVESPHSPMMEASTGPLSPRPELASRRRRASSIRDLGLEHKQDYFSATRGNNPHLESNGARQGGPLNTRVSHSKEEHEDAMSPDSSYGPLPIIVTQNASQEEERKPRFGVPAPERSLSKDEVIRVKSAIKRIFGGIRDQRIVVDYEKSVFEVCRDFLEFVIPRSKSLDILCHPWAPEPDTGKKEPPLPTWIPRLCNNAFALGPNRAYRRVNADPLVGKPGLDMKVYNAHKGYPVSSQWGMLKTNKRILVVQGFVLDKIGRRFTPAIEGIIPLEWLEAVGWTDTKESPPDVFWRTLVANRDAHAKRPPSHWKRACKDTFSRRPRGGDLNTKELLSYDCPSAIHDFLKRIQCVTWKRKLVMFQKYGMPSHLGLAPSTVKKGDLVCILHGCSVPVILRKFVDGQPAAKLCADADVKGEVLYEWVGDCYVHGFMDGEATRLPEVPPEDGHVSRLPENPGDSGEFHIQ